MLHCKDVWLERWCGSFVWSAPRAGEVRCSEVGFEGLDLNAMVFLPTGVASTCDALAGTPFALVKQHVDVDQGAVDTNVDVDNVHPQYVFALYLLCFAGFYVGVMCSRMIV